MNANNTYKIAENIYISGFLNPELLRKLIKDLNISTVINNRPDGEEIGQMTSDEVRRLCQEHDIEYHYIPITSFSSITQSDKEDFMDIVLKTPGDKNILAFCRSGRRSEALYIKKK